jgi:hypothetical protein
MFVKGMLQLDCLARFSHLARISDSPTYPDTTCDCIDSIRRVSAVIMAIEIEVQEKRQIT